MLLTELGAHFKQTTFALQGQHDAVSTARERLARGLARLHAAMAAGSSEAERILATQETAVLLAGFERSPPPLQPETDVTALAFVPAAATLQADLATAGQISVHAACAATTTAAGPGLAAVQAPGPATFT